MKSADLPTSMEPISSSRSMAIAPLRVKIWIAVSTSAGSVASRVMELIGVGDDERFATFEGRVEHREEIFERFRRLDEHGGSIPTVRLVASEAVPRPGRVVDGPPGGLGP